MIGQLNVHSIYQINLFNKLIDELAHRIDEKAYFYFFIIILAYNYS